MSDLVAKVWTIEAALEDHWLAHIESFDHIFLDFVSRSSRKPKKWNSWIPFPEHTELEVVLPEVLTPMRHAVNLVNHESINASLFIKLIHYRNKSITLGQLLWGQIYDSMLQLTDLAVVVAHLFVFVLGVGG